MHRPKKIYPRRDEERKRCRHRVVRSQEMGAPQRVFFTAHPRHREGICVEHASARKCERCKVQIKNEVSKIHGLLSGQVADQETGKFVGWSALAAVLGIKSR